MNQPMFIKHVKIIVQIWSGHFVKRSRWFDNHQSASLFTFTHGQDKCSEIKRHLIWWWRHADLHTHRRRRMELITLPWMNQWGCLCVPLSRTQSIRVHLPCRIVDSVVCGDVMIQCLLCTGRFHLPRMEHESEETSPVELRRLFLQSAHRLTYECNRTYMDSSTNTSTNYQEWKSNISTFTAAAGFKL